VRRITHSKTTFAIFVTMVTVVILAITASILFAAMSTASHASNTVYIAELGTISCTASAPAKLYPGGTSEGTVKFEIKSGTNLVTAGKVTNFKLTSFTIKWGTGSDQSATFSTGITNANNSATVVTTAGNWVFALNLGSGLDIGGSASGTCALTVTVPQGFDTSSSIPSWVSGGSPKDGYLVGNVTGVTCQFTVDVEATAV